MNHCINENERKRLERIKMNNLEEENTKDPDLLIHINRCSLKDFISEIRIKQIIMF